MALEGIQIGTRRDKLTIMADLLTNMQEPKRLTHVLYASNMSYGQLVKYLDKLTAMGLIQENQHPYRSFGITDNGKIFMNLVKGKGIQNTST